MQAQTAGIQAGLQQQEANNILNVGNYNASEAAFEGQQALGNQAETYNAGGVMLAGSPLAMLNQTRSQATLNIQQIQQQAGLQAQMANTQANQTINASRAQLLGVSNQYTAGLTQADIQQEDVLPRDIGAAFSLFSGNIGQGINNLMGGGSSGGGGGLGPIDMDPLSFDAGIE